MDKTYPHHELVEELKETCAKMEINGHLPEGVKKSFNNLLDTYQASHPVHRSRDLENGLKDFQKTCEKESKGVYMKTLTNLVKCALSVVKETIIGTPASLNFARAKYDQAVKKTKISGELHSLKESVSKTRNTIQNTKVKDNVPKTGKSSDNSKGR
jgi:hypothetical protein